MRLRPGLEGFRVAVDKAGGLIAFGALIWDLLLSRCVSGRPGPGAIRDQLRTKSVKHKIDEAVRKQEHSPRSLRQRVLRNHYCSRQFRIFNCRDGSHFELVLQRCQEATKGLLVRRIHLHVRQNEDDEIQTSVA